MADDAKQTTKQEELLPFLRDAASYKQRPGRVQFIQTHSSFVFLVPPFVYKIKKAVNFGFLDYSTLEKRRHFCEREVELNRRLCPQVYLGVVPISKKGESFVFGRRKQVVEYAVKMRKLSSACFLDKLVQRNAIKLQDLDRVAAVLTNFYKAQRPTKAIEEWGRIELLKISTDENFKQVRDFVGHALSRAAFDAIRSYTSRFYDSHRALFEARIRDRRIRDCHGDLHLEHVHLTRRAVHI